MTSVNTGQPCCCGCDCFRSLYQGCNDPRISVSLSSNSGPTWECGPDNSCVFTATATVGTPGEVLMEWWGIGPCGSGFCYACGIESGGEPGNREVVFRVPYFATCVEVFYNVVYRVTCPDGSKTVCEAWNGSPCAQCCPCGDCVKTKRNPDIPCETCQESGGFACEDGSTVSLRIAGNDDCSWSGELQQRFGYYTGNCTYHYSTLTYPPPPTPYTYVTADVYISPCSVNVEWARVYVPGFPFDSSYHSVDAVLFGPFCCPGGSITGAGHCIPGPDSGTTTDVTITVSCDGNPLPSDPPTSYDCVDGTCTERDDDGGTYATLEDCIASTCGAPPPGPTSYDCVGGTCTERDDDGGTYATLADCIASTCGAPPATFNCDSSLCVDPGDGTGFFSTLEDCVNAGCNPPPDTPTYCDGIFDCPYPYVMPVKIAGFADCSPDGGTTTFRWSNLNADYDLEQTTDYCGVTPDTNEIVLTAILGTPDDYGDPGVLIEEQFVSSTHNEWYATQIWVVLACVNDPTHEIYISKVVIAWQKWRWFAGSSTPPVVIDSGCYTFDTPGYTPLGSTPAPCHTSHMGTLFEYDLCGTFEVFGVSTSGLIGAP
jgi:hypothetical protein